MSYFIRDGSTDSICTIYKVLTHLSSPLPGDKYWVFKEVTAEPGYPHSLVELGSCLPKDGIDTALRWEPVGKTYFFKGDQYWRYNEEKRTADPGYPKPITVWKGVPDGPQGAFISREGCECLTQPRGNDPRQKSDPEVNLIKTDFLLWS